MKLFTIGRNIGKICDPDYYQLSLTLKQIIYGLNSYLYSSDVSNICIIGYDDLYTKELIHQLKQMIYIKYNMDIYFYTESEIDSISTSLENNCDYILSTLYHKDSEILHNLDNNHIVYIRVTEPEIYFNSELYNNSIFIGEINGDFISSYTNILIEGYNIYGKFDKKLSFSPGIDIILILIIQSLFTIDKEYLNENGYEYFLNENNYLTSHFIIKGYNTNNGFFTLFKTFYQIIGEPFEIEISFFYKYIIP